MSTYVMPPAYPHGAIEQLFEDVFLVTGTVSAKLGPISMCFSRNMTVVRSGESLSLVNTVRLDEAGLKALDALGKVEHVVRVAGFHGMDDPFYADRYGAKVWTVRGQKYMRGFAPPKESDVGYFRGHVEMDADGELPIPNARLVTFDSALVPEGMVLLERDGGILLPGDSLQNWAAPDEFFNIWGRLLMRMMGFFKAHNLGPGWVKTTKPSGEDVRRVLDLSFDHVLPAHGRPVLGGAKAAYRPAIEAYAGA